MLLIAALMYTLVFNVAWAWGTGWLSVGAAAACTLIVPAGLHLWPTIPAETKARRALRALVMTGVCASAIITSFSHSVSVLLAAGWTEFTAWSVTGGAELLVALSTMALVGSAQPAEQANGQSEDGQADNPDPNSPDSCGQATPDGDEQADEQVSKQVARQVSGQVGGQHANRPPRPRRRLSAVPTNRSEKLAGEFLAWATDQPKRPSGYAVRQRFGCGRDVAVQLLALLDDDPAEAVS